MREKQMRYLVTFSSTTKAIAMEKFAREQKLPGRLIPVPREITAGCGMAWCAPLKSHERIGKSMRACAIDFEKEYELLV